MDLFYKNVSLILKVKQCQTELKVYRFLRRQNTKWRLTICTGSQHRIIAATDLVLELPEN